MEIREAFIISLFERLNRIGIQYCILHGWQSLPGHLSSDIDLVVAPEDLAVFEKVLRNNDFKWRITQLIRYKATGFHFVLAVGNGSCLAHIAIDVITDYRWNGRVYFRAEELLRDRQKWNCFWVAASEAEFAYLLVKNVCKLNLSEHKIARLQELKTSLGDETDAIAQNLFGLKWGSRVTEWLARSDWANLEAHVFNLKYALRREAVKRDPLNSLRYFPSELTRILQRWRYPTGLFVVVLGSDGAGKSTLIQHLRQSLTGVFHRTDVFHLRPDIIGRKGANGPVTDPHGKQPHNLWLSLFKIPYYLLDYGLGYLLSIRPRIVRSTLVMFDRYYDDLLVDPRRYRYGGPLWLVRLARRFVMRPDLFLILQVPEQQLLTRKREISSDELIRQRKAYRLFAMEFPNAILLDGSLPAEEVARNASEAVLHHLHQRYLKLGHFWFY